MIKKLIWRMADPPYFKNVPEKAGIYIISTMQKTDGEFEVKYIGQADNLSARANEHWSKKETNTELKNHIAEKYIMKFNYSLVESKSDRDGMVIYACQKYKPPYNRDLDTDIEVVKCTMPAVRASLSRRSVNEKT